ncbi:AMP-binding protein [Serinibacter salmoneus]|uniref:O-succinylbenzoic acid--CoA ligase n=1 Tax=Serinibacter salmoneus TaxID=556530 RepID=A0A2A9D2L3_9MICO|nr:AMP-binding protein [Serinibacter salmoneus]PFG20566.1 O-succinylbenzoic acid--CoA ligase [Serinibacter salmoneus]
MPHDLPTSAPGRAADRGLRDLLAAALAGEGTLDLTGRTPQLVPRDPAGHAAPAAVLVATSGSTSGRPDRIAITASAIRASVAATQEALGGPGAWLLTLAPDHIAGLMVLARGLLGGGPVTHAAPGPFRPDSFVRDAERLAATAPGARRYVSLVPTQLRRVLSDPAARESAAGFEAILVGGSATPPAMLEQARAAGLAVVTTYGMTETCGGCLYDGVPVGAARADLIDPDRDGAGRIVLRGPQVALGRLASDGALLPFHGEVVTADRGRWERGADGVRRLRVLGRIDEVILSGGLNVDPHQVADVITRLDSVAEACVVGVPDPEWGQRVVAVVVPAATPHALTGSAGSLPDDVRAVCAAALPRGWAPQEVLVTDHLPTRGPGKVDRRAVAAYAVARLQGESRAASEDVTAEVSAPRDEESQRTN